MTNTNKTTEQILLVVVISMDCIYFYSVFTVLVYVVCFTIKVLFLYFILPIRHINLFIF